jgi:Tol biopolymer transport system component
MQVSISGDGRFVAFQSLASNLVPGDTNGTWDIFVRDRQAGVTDRISMGFDGSQANGASRLPSITPNARFVSFHSEATNLVPGDTNGREDVFVHDRELGITERVSVASDGSQGNGTSVQSTITPDGRYVAFRSSASNLVPGDTNARDDVFVHDRETGITERVSVDSEGSEANGPSWLPSLSADGRYVAFESQASNLVPGDTNGAWDIFVHDRETGITERVSVDSRGNQGNGDAFSAKLSADGRHVAFWSRASNLVPNDTNGLFDVFVHDRESGRTERVSVASEGWEGVHGSVGVGLSADGRFVTFQSFASNLAPDVTNGLPDVFVHDRRTRATDRVSVASDGSESDHVSSAPAISADGRYVAFTSTASNLVPGNEANANTTTPIPQVYVRDRGPAAGVGEVSATQDEDGLTVSGWATFSGRVLTSSEDSPDDGLPGADELGGEILRADLIHRSEQEDLLFRLQLKSIPPAPAGLGIVYALAFELDGVGYEIRGNRNSVSGQPATAPDFALYRCELRCERETPAKGGIGTVGHEVLISVPLLPLDVAGDVSLERIRASTALGETEPGGIVPLDEVELDDAILSLPRLRWAIAPVDTEEAEVEFDKPATFKEGRFAAIGEPTGLPKESSKVWAQGCLGETCGAASGPLVDPAPAPPPIPMHTFSHSGHIVGSNPSSPFVGGLTENAFLVSECEMPPRAQGLDGYVIEIPSEYREGTAIAAVKGSNQLNSYDLDLVFFRDCELIHQWATPEPDEVAEVPEGTVFLIVSAAHGVGTEFSLDLNAPATPDPTPSPTPSPKPTEPEATDVKFTDRSAVSGQYTDETFFEARLTDAEGEPLEELSLIFTLVGEGSSRDFSAGTNESGIASVTTTLSEPPGPYQLTVRFEGDESRAPSADSIAFVVERKDTDTMLTVQGQGQGMSLRARLSHLGSPARRVADRGIDFYSDGELIGSDTTDADGIAEVPVPPGHRGANRTYEAIFEGDNFFGPSSDKRPGRGGGQGGGETAQQQPGARGTTVVPR